MSSHPQRSPRGACQWSEALYDCLRADRRYRPPRLARLDDKLLVERIPRRREAMLGRWLVMAGIVADQRAGDTELHVGIDVLIVRRVNLRDHGFIARLVDHEMQMRGAVMMPARRAH